MSDALAPFQLFETTSGSWSLMLTDQHFGAVSDVFETVEGFIGNGYDWASVCDALVARDAPQLGGKFGTDPEAGMFVAYGTDKASLEELGNLLASAYADRERLADLVAIAELD